MTPTAVSTPETGDVAQPDQQHARRVSILPAICPRASWNSFCRCTARSRRASRNWRCKRVEVLQRSLEGDKPTHRFPSDTVRNGWRITLPEWCRDQRNQMTGPADDARTVRQDAELGRARRDARSGRFLRQRMVASRNWASPTFWPACADSSAFYDKKRGADGDDSAEQHGDLHPAAGIAFEPGWTDSRRTGFGFAVRRGRIFYEIDPAELKHPLCIYIPKSESAEEALWWRDLFQALAQWRGLPHDYIKCMALVESHPLAFQMEEFAYNLRDHIIGLNLGRWDYMASLIHFNLDDPDWVLPDRNTIPHNVPFFQNLRELMPEICHHRGILAIGGMTALYPSREDARTECPRARRSRKRQEERSRLPDGRRLDRPSGPERDRRGAIPFPNQLQSRPRNASRYPDLRPAPAGVGERTVKGTRAAVRTVIRYRHGVLSGKGASLLDGYMEDLATDRIYRLMIAQRVLHRDLVCDQRRTGRGREAHAGVHHASYSTKSSSGCCASYRPAQNRRSRPLPPRPRNQ